MRVTCICVCHNKPRLAHEAVESIVSQTHQDWEALVIDSGVLYHAGYYDQFDWRRDRRIKLICSAETEEIRRTKAMAPWCFNECFRKGRVTGDLVMYLCDDDILYPNAFDTFASYCRRHPGAQAMYASQDIGAIYPNGWRAIVGERRATVPGGQACGGRDMDCQVDYLQLCHRVDVLKQFPDNEYWPESKEFESHADGIFMERLGQLVAIHPIDIKVSQNRRTPQSTFDPVPSLAEASPEFMSALTSLQKRLDQITDHNEMLEARLDSFRYRVADCLHDMAARVPLVKRGIQWLRTTV
jgi:glycosyltransferase involved in cell wall biosynthesis